MRVFAFFLLVTLGACADVASQSNSTMSDGAAVHTFRCDNGWDGCYRAANELCGEAGFTEIDRLPDAGSTGNEQLEALRRADDGIESKRLPADGMRDTRRDGILTVRCDRR